VPLTVETRIGLLEQKGAAMEERLEWINRSIDRVVPYGEAIMEVRGNVAGALDDVREIREDIVQLRETVAANEASRRTDDRQRRDDRLADRKLLWGIFGGLGAATIAGICGIIAAGIHP
jgi:hypothetical protein